MRDEFKNILYTPKETVTDILITTGGTDIYEITKNIVDVVVNKSEFKNITFHIISGIFSSKDMKIKQEYNNIRYYHNVKKMSELMIQCDIAITAGGSTMYELCACGIPSISFSFADNQKPGVYEFNRNGIIPYAGDARDGVESLISNIICKIKKYIINYKVRKKISQKMCALVDGQGSDRIAKYIMQD